MAPLHTEELLRWSRQRRERTRSTLCQKSPTTCSTWGNS